MKPERIKKVGFADEMGRVARKIIKEKKEMARKGERCLSEEEAISKYR